VVVCPGETIVEVSPDTGPPPLSMLRVVAPVTLQESVEVDPALMVAGFALKAVMVGAETGGGLTVTVTGAVAVPALLLALRV